MLRHNLIELALFSCLGLCAWHGKGAADREVRARRLWALASAGAYGLTIEYLVYVVIEKFQPRLYDHEDKFALMVGRTGIPLYIVALWQVFLYVSDQAANRLKGGWLRTILVSALLAISLDLDMEPCAMAQLHWNYRLNQTGHHWELGPTWNGAPLNNLIAWGMMQAAFTTSLILFPDFTSWKHLVSRFVLGVALCFALFGFMTAILELISGTNFLLAVSLLGGFAFLDSLQGAVSLRLESDWQVCGIVALWHGYTIASIAWQPKSDLYFSRNQTLEIVMLAVASWGLFAFACTSPALLLEPSFSRSKPLLSGSGRRSQSPAPASSPPQQPEPKTNSVKFKPASARKKQSR